ncbi:MAG: PfkB family carbohydrate kinase [bacterium]|nr:PfkB family carbohydrate kinase [bacterium]
MSDYRYNAMIGAGGIGTGSFFLLEGNHTLGREESRGGRFLDRRDYCKLHIISHYVQALLGADFKTVPIGKVGADDAGDRLFGEMSEAGLNLRYVRKSQTLPTLFSFCYIYPDGSGGNMTTTDSACSEVDAVFIAEAEEEFNSYKGMGIALAVPEVSLQARAELLRLATEHGFLRVASFTSEEIQAGGINDMLAQTDLLAINLDEAGAIARMNPESRTPEEIVEGCVQAVARKNPKMQISITAGSKGSWCRDGNILHHIPVHRVKAESTAGAGDAYVSGIIAGLTAGLDLKDAAYLGSLTGAMSVTSPHTINKEINRKSLQAFAGDNSIPVNGAVQGFLRGRI